MNTARPGPVAAGGRSWRRLAALVPLGAAVLVSAGTLGHGFVWDDVYNVLQNPWIRGEGRLHEAFGTHVAGFLPDRQTAYYRPLFHVVLALVHRAAGTRPLAYHLVSVALYALTCLLLYAVLRRLLELDRAAEGDPHRLQAPAVLAATLFAVHPVHSEAVAWISGLMDLLGALFTLATLWIALRPGPRLGARRALGAAAFAAALLSKEPALAALPVVALVRLVPSRKGSDDRREAWAFLLTLTVVAVAYAALRAHALGGLLGDGAGRVTGLAPTVLNAPVLLLAYAAALFVPTDVLPLRDVTLAASVLDARALAGLGLAGALVAAAYRFRRRRAVLAGVSLFVAGLLPALYLPALGEAVFSTRYLLLPSAGAAILAGAWLGRGAPPRAPAALRAAVGLGLVLAGAALTVRANAAWHDPVSLWSAVAAQRPGNAAAHEAHGAALLLDGRPDLAVAPLRRALAIDPSRGEARVNLASARLATGDLAGALVEADAAVRAAPGIPEAHAVRGHALLAAGNPRAALASYQEALRRNPGLEPARRGLADAAARLRAPP